MQIPGNNNKNNAKLMHISERADQMVHGERGNRKIPDSHNRPHPIQAVNDASIYANPNKHAVAFRLRSIPDSHNTENY